jgi:hypothetical protein
MESELADYIRKNREIYTAEGINDTLMGEGYTAEEIDAAWLLVQREDARTQVNSNVPAGPQSRPNLGVQGTPVGVGFVLMYICLVIFGAALVLLTNLGLAFTHSNSGIETVQTLVNLGSLVAGIGLLVGGLILLRRGWPAGRVSALILVLGLFWYVVLTGTCLYAPSVLR